MRNPLSKKIIEIEPSGIRKFFDVANEMKDAISLGVGEPDFDTPWRIREEGIFSLERGRTFYTSNAGLQELRDEICNYLERKIHVRYDSRHETLVTVGGSEAIDVGLRLSLIHILESGAKHIDGAFLKPGEEYSANAAMEPYTEENGFTTAASYEDDKVVESMGGGICQISTTLYNAVLFA